MKQEELFKEYENLNSSSSIKDVQEYIRNMVKSRGFDDESLQDQMLLLTEEIGELAKEVRKTTAIKMDVNQKRENKMKYEIADVFMYLLCICNTEGIDLLDALKSKEELNFKREWK